MKNIILIAPPAAGKGTLAEILNEKYKMVHISTGDLLREVAKREDALGSYIKDTLASGAFVKDEIIYQLLEERLSQADCENGYILDGFPRNMEQAKKYQEILNNIQKKLDYVIVIDVDKELLKQRITGRRICSECGAIYNIHIKETAPKEESTCDQCKGKLYQRSDDNLEAFAHRYQTYLDKTEALIDYYQKQGVLYHIEGNLGIEKMLEEVETIIIGKRGNND